MKFLVILALVAACNSELLLTKLRKLSKRDVNYYPYGGIGGGCGSQPQGMVQPSVGQVMLRPPQIQPQPQVVYVQQHPYYQQALQYGSNCASCVSNSYLPSCYQSCSGGLNRQCITSCNPQCQSSCQSNNNYPYYGQPQPQLSFQPQIQQPRPVLY